MSTTKQERLTVEELLIVSNTMAPVDFMALLDEQGTTDDERQEILFGVTCGLPTDGKNQVFKKMADLTTDLDSKDALNGYCLKHAA